MTQHIPTRQLRFFMTAVAPCPYLPGMTERKVFANLPFSDGAHVNDELTHAGFRRSQNIAYRPACEGCDACVSVRLPVPEFVFSRSQRKVLNRNADLSRALVEAEATTEQFDLLKRYLSTRHPGGGMAGMDEDDYADMVEHSPVNSFIVEYRLPAVDGRQGRLIGCCLTDQQADGLSMIYSFFDADDTSRPALGNFIIMDHILRAHSAGLSYVYLGYWVKGSQRMEYKTRFRPIEVLGPNGWAEFDPDADPVPIHAPRVRELA